MEQISDRERVAKMAEPDRLRLAVNHALEDRRVAQLRARAAFLGLGQDDKRPLAWQEYGFREDINFIHLYGLYARGGLAHGAVEKLIGKCWESDPWLIEGDPDDNDEKETAWEKAVKRFTKRFRLWSLFAELDRRRLVGRYSGLLMRYGDSRAWDQPLEKRQANLVEMIPAWAGSLTVADWDTEPTSQTYGQPKMWQFTETSMNGRGEPGRQLTVHPDRIFILGDYRAAAIGFLEPAYNNFVSLEKVEGGSGESFLKNASRQINVNFDKDIDLGNLAATYGVKLPDLKRMYNDAARELNRGNDVMLITQGAQASTLTSVVPDPEPHYNINLQSVSAAVDIPSKILVGMQTGERASSEDQKYFNARCQSRRRQLGFEIEDFFNRLFKQNVLAAPPLEDGLPYYSVMWTDLTEPTRAEKLANAKTMAEVNSASLASGAPPFGLNEVREAAGYEPDDDLEAEPLAEDGADDELDDQQGDDDATRSNPAR